MVSFLRWTLRTTIFVVVALLAVRALVEYAPSLMAIPLIGAIVRWWDPVLQRLVERTGVEWSRDMRGIGLPAVAVVLVVLRVMLDDLLARLQPKPERPERAAKKAAAAQQEDSTVITPALAPAAAAPQPVQTATGTAFMPAFKPAGPPAHIGRYEILGELGHGAMGTVYKARDPKIGRTVAIKTISTVGLGPELEQYRERFLLEAKSAGRLTHAGVVAVYDVADDDAGRPCLVLEFVEGVTLDRIISDAPLPLPKALDYVSQIARALDYAHSHGIVHRDVKPANIMVMPSGQAKLSDFGIAKIEGTTLTVAGQVLGTPAFMSPEQCRGDPIDHRSDIFSLGAVLYLLVAHTKPFPGETFTSVAYQVVHNEHVPVDQIDPGLPHEIEGIISRCLAKSSQGRYASAARIADDIDALRARLAGTGGVSATGPHARPQG